MNLVSRELVISGGSALFGNDLVAKCLIALHAIDYSGFHLQRSPLEETAPRKKPSGF